MARHSRTVKGITHEQRYQLCLKKQACPNMKQSELASWFKDQYAFSISQPTISHSLKKSNEILATGPSAPGIEPNGVRKRRVRHPELELAIYQWLSNKRSDGTGLISGPVLIAQAKKIAQEMNIHDTVFCPGWLARFKARYGIQSLRSHGGGSRHQESQQMTASPTTTPVATSITIANDSATSSCSPSPTTSPPPSPTESSPCTAPSFRNSISAVAGLIEVRPSIAVPATIDSTHAALQLHQQHQHDMYLPDPAAIPPHTDGHLEAVASRHCMAVAEHQKHDEHHLQQPQQHHRDAHILQPYRRHPHHNPSQSHHTFASIQSSTSPSHASSPTAMHLEFLHSIPIASSPSESSFRQQHLGLASTDALIGPPSVSSSSSSLPASPISHGQTPFTNGSDAYQSSAATSGSITPFDRTQELDLREVPQTLQQGRRLVLQLRKYVSSHLQDPTRALSALEVLQSELELTRTREAITISESEEMDAQ
ncbi:hypothetical protein KVV02_000200 [Mortierella alpina]|uniref:HTH CENPB-type domain-containing protein n=1 Tax=Mortierella alpina TaxID=64518 RepID=A0A9P8IFC6_MORAP|nr:hypothetical protein KVV02_000200 [Mortierella alpina]